MSYFLADRRTKYFIGSIVLISQLQERQETTKSWRSVVYKGYLLHFDNLL